MASSLRLGVAGLGTVGAALLRSIETKGGLLAARAGRPLEIAAVCARDRHRERGIDLASARWFDDPVKLAAEAGIDVFVELVGGSDGAALDAVRAALIRGLPVVTANKALLAHHGVALAKLAHRKNAVIAFEAAVAGGIPIVKTLREALRGNTVSRVYGILNGTCNYILTRMEREGLSFDACLTEAQRLGYAEADPTFDIGGFDAAHKLVILTALAFGCEIDLDAAFIEGIETVATEDIRAAADLGYRIKLLAVAQRTETGIEQRVHPAMVPASSAIAQVDGVLNAVAVDTDLLGSILLVGPGAGGDATASAVLADILDLASGARVATLGVPTADLQPYRRAPERRGRGQGAEAERPRRRRRRDRIGGDRRHRRHRERRGAPAVRAPGRSAGEGRARADAAPRGRLLHPPVGS